MASFAETLEGRTELSSVELLSALDHLQTPGLDSRYGRLAEHLHRLETYLQSYSERHKRQLLALVLAGFAVLWDLDMQERHELATSSYNTIRGLENAAEATAEKMKDLATRLAHEQSFDALEAIIPPLNETFRQLGRPIAALKGYKTQEIRDLRRKLSGYKPHFLIGVLGSVFVLHQMYFLKMPYSALAICLGLCAATFIMEVIEIALLRIERKLAIPDWRSMFVNFMYQSIYRRSLGCSYFLGLQNSYERLLKFVDELRLRIGRFDF